MTARTADGEPVGEDPGQGRARGRRSWWYALGAVAVVVMVVAFALFRPDKLFVDDTVDEELADDVVAALAAGTGPDGAPEVAPLDPGGSAAADDPSPTAPTTTVPPVLAQGEFTSHGRYTVNGSAFVVDRPEGRLLVLLELDSDNGPDLQLYLSPHSGGSVDGGVKLGPLKGNKGTQSYEVPDEVDLAMLANVVIWCERFAAPFGTATMA